VRSRQPVVANGFAREAVDGLEYVWIRTPAYEGNGFARIRNMAAFVARLSTQEAELTRDFKPDAVIASSTYPLDILPASRLARRHGARLMFEVHDLWPLSPMELGNFSRWHPFIMTMQMAENFAYRRADKVISMLPNAEAHMQSHGLAPGKFVYIPNGIDVAEWEHAREPLPQALLARLRDLRASGRFIVCYAGAHGIANALDTLLEAAALTRDQPINYVLVGQGPEKARLRALAAERRLSNVELHDAVPKQAVPALLAQADILYVGLQRQPLFRFGISPNKLMDYMMAGRPVIMSIEAGNDMVAEAGCGISVPAEDSVAVADAVRQLASLPREKRADFGERGRHYVLTHHDYNILAERFLDALQQP
jgi:glycosyltransferase involved in cell wall biosynthesis